MLMYMLFGVGGGSVKVYVLYTQLNVDNYGWPLKSFIFADNIYLKEFWIMFNSHLEFSIHIQFSLQF